MMRLYNSKQLKVEEFIPLVENEVSMYVCGPTVYNHIHIGNARPIIVFDTLRRVFEALGYTVKYVSNYTDVDDKIILKAKEMGVSESEVTTKYIEAYNEIRHRLNAHDLSSTPKVTETMDEIIDFIEQCVNNDFAYVVDGDVYFRVKKVETYGEVSHQKIDDLQVGARIEENTTKESPLDFALWKKMDDGLRWQSPWSLGRPGWHTECVVMIQKEFNKPLIDIHGGGMDLKFPHHENEVAQSRAVCGTSLANYWLHNGMININGVKMSKSLGNFTLAKDILEKFSPELIRWLMLSVHYRMELNFSDEVFDNAEKELTKVLGPLKQATIKMLLQNKSFSGEYHRDLFQQFMDAMSDDLNTPNAMSVIFETIKKVNLNLRSKEWNSDECGQLVTTVEKMLDVLGIKVEPIQLSDEARELFTLWNQAKADRDFEKADTYRVQLSALGLV